MKKFLLLLLFVCVGCSIQNSSIQDALNTEMNLAYDEIPQTTNYRNDLYAYYLAPDVGRVSATQMGNTFNYNGNLIQMNLNVQKIINDKYYEGKEYANIHFPDELKVASFEGMFDTLEQETHPYVIDVFEINNQYYTTFKSDHVLFGSISNKHSVASIAAEMLRIAKSLVVDYNAVVTKFSTKDVITYESTSIDLFENIVPEEGNIEELFKVDEFNNIVDIDE